MLFVYIFLSLTIGITAAVPQDLSGKMMIFPQETSTAHVRLTTSRQNMGAVTVCLRFFSDLTRGKTLFSLATPSHANDFLIYHNGNDFVVYVRNLATTFKGLDFKQNQWQSVCATWEAASGLVQLWVDGKPSSFRFSTNSNISGPIIIVLGQDQDSYGGGFVASKSFVGMISDVHMWDYVLSSCYIKNYDLYLNFPPGNLISWQSMEFQITGRVLVQNEPEC